MTLKTCTRVNDKIKETTMGLGRQKRISRGERDRKHVLVNLLTAWECCGFKNADITLYIYDIIYITLYLYTYLKC